MAMLAHISFAWAKKNTPQELQSTANKHMYTVHMSERKKVPIQHAQPAKKPLTWFDQCGQCRTHSKNWVGRCSMRAQMLADRQLVVSGP